MYQFEPNNIIGTNDTPSKSDNSSEPMIFFSQQHHHHHVVCDSQGEEEGEEEGALKVSMAMTMDAILTMAMVPEFQDVSMIYLYGVLSLE